MKCMAVFSSKALCGTIHYLILAQNSVLIEGGHWFCDGG